MSILDTITSLNQEASVRASSEPEKGGKSHAPDEPMQMMEENEHDMIIDEDSDQEGKPLEEPKMATEDVQAAEVKMENTHEQVEVGKEPLSEEVKMEEEEESGAHEHTEEKSEKNKDGGKVSEEKPDEETVKSTSQAKENAREKIKEGDLLCPLFWHF